jgi:hypothetical protein
MSTRQYDFEALAEVTGTDWEVGRGELNVALKIIRAQSEITDGYLLAAEIHDRAKMYRHVMPDVMLTPTALAKHWKRVQEEATKERGTNLTAEKPLPLPKERGIPEWCQIWWWTRRYRKPRILIPLPQQEPDNPDAMSMKEYEKLREEWVAAGSPRGSAAEILGTKKRDYAGETAELLKGIA